MSRGRLVVHGHFYQPWRLDPFSGRVPADPSAAPAHDWTARVSEESYRPNAERGNLGHLSWDIGPTLASWMRDGDPVAYDGFITGDRGVNGLAQSYHHSILPLASAADRRTEVLWGLRDFELRFGRPSVGMWLPETAVDLATLRILAESGVRHTILAPWQAADPELETRQPYRVDLGGGRDIVVAFYDAGLSASASFEPNATADADRFARDRIEPRFAPGALPDGAPPFALIATDGELYGHHQVFGEMFLERLVRPRPTDPPRAYDVVSLAEALRESPDRPFPAVEIVERTSWSCHHGVLRWSAECPCAADGRWKGPLRSALDRLAAGIDAVTDGVAAGLAGSPDPWAARDAYIDVLFGVEEATAFSQRWLGPGAGREDGTRFLALMEVQRWRLAMFTSDGWFWDDPIRQETVNVLRAAARAARLADGLLGQRGRLEHRLVDDLRTLTSPSFRIDGAEIYRQALADVGQPPPDVLASAAEGTTHGGSRVG